MKELGVTTLVFAAVAWLIPYPGLIWLSGIVWVGAWFALPAAPKQSPKGLRSKRSEKARSALRP